MVGLNHQWVILVLRVSNAAKINMWLMVEIFQGKQDGRGVSLQNGKQPEGTHRHIFNRKYQEVPEGITVDLNSALKDHVLIVQRFHHFRFFLQEKTDDEKYYIYVTSTITSN